MKQINIVVLLIILMSMIGEHVFAHDFEAKNADGVTIYYCIPNRDKAEVGVVHRGGEKEYNKYPDRYTGRVVIPGSVTYNGQEYSVTYIGYDAFYGCSSLTSVSIPSSVKSIDSGAFEGCSSLTSVNIPNGVTVIFSETFKGCSSLSSIEIPNSVTHIGEEAFGGCNALASISIPNSVTLIGRDAFAETAWYENQPEGLVYAGNIAYKLKGRMPERTKLVIKDGTIGITQNAFKNYSTPISIVIPNSMKEIGWSAFYGSI